VGGRRRALGEWGQRSARAESLLFRERTGWATGGMAMSQLLFSMCVSLGGTKPTYASLKCEIWRQEPNSKQTVCCWLVIYFAPEKPLKAKERRQKRRSARRSRWQVGSWQSGKNDFNPSHAGKKIRCLVMSHMGNAIWQMTE